MRERALDSFQLLGDGCLQGGQCVFAADFHRPGRAKRLAAELEEFWLFARRLRFIINFPFPNASDRLMIWKQAFPQGVPLDENLNFERLAKLNLTGGNIHSIAINAAFLAASRDSPRVTLPFILEAARDELRKLDKQFSETDFRA